MRVSATSFSASVIPLTSFCTVRLHLRTLFCLCYPPSPSILPPLNFPTSFTIPSPYLVPYRPVNFRWQTFSLHILCATLPPQFPHISVSSVRMSNSVLDAVVLAVSTIQESRTFSQHLFWCDHVHLHIHLRPSAICESLTVKVVLFTCVSVSSVTLYPAFRHRLTAHDFSSPHFPPDSLGISSCSLHIGAAQLFTFGFSVHLLLFDPLIHLCLQSLSSPFTSHRVIR